MSADKMKVRFWGVRGSIPAPITSAAIEDKVAGALLALGKASETAIGPLPQDLNGMKAWMKQYIPAGLLETVGGNTPCVEVRCGDELIILDAGSGIRGLGGALVGEMFARKGDHIGATMLLSHVHWDHIQGYPFFAPLFLPRRRFSVRLDLYGGDEWARTLEDVLRGQMNPPVFPVNHLEIERIGATTRFNTVHDGLTLSLGPENDPVRILARKLHHPQETYGYRIEWHGKVLSYCTDHEPCGAGIPAGLRELVAGSDWFITDCQYSLDQYTGRSGGVERFGWGHSYPEYVAEVATAAGAKGILTFHHDPAASDEQVHALAQQTAELSGLPAIAAREGMLLMEAL